MSVSIKPKKFLKSHLFLLPQTISSYIVSLAAEKPDYFFFGDSCFSFFLQKERITEIRIGLVVLLAVLGDIKKYFI